LTDERVEWRLAAELAADVAGYRRLMAVDEEGTPARLKSVRKTLIDPAIPLLIQSGIAPRLSSAQWTLRSQMDLLSSAEPVRWGPH
jgi:hypothetical protein